MALTFLTASSSTVQAFIFGILPIAQWLGAANSCINPILYAFMNRKFRAGFRHLFRSCCSSEDDEWDQPTTVLRSDDTREQMLRRIRTERHFVRNGTTNGVGTPQGGPLRYSQSTKVQIQSNRVDWFFNRCQNSNVNLDVQNLSIFPSILISTSHIPKPLTWWAEVKNKSTIR